jgi:hypothetical protein
MKRSPVAGRVSAHTWQPQPACENRPSPDPGHAWNVLAVVSESIRHAEMKGALIMGAAGAVGGLLYNLYGNDTHHRIIVDVAVAFCGLSTVAAATFAALCLTPRLRSKDGPNSVVYFHHIARRHNTATGFADYGAVLKTMSSDHDRLIEDIAAQIWANAHIACQKFLMARLGVIAILTAFVTLATIVIMIV